MNSWGKEEWKTLSIIFGLILLELLFSHFGFGGHGSHGMLE